MFRIIVHNEDLKNPISTKLKRKIEDFGLNETEDLVNTVEYHNVELENSEITVQSVKIPTGSSRLYLSKDTVTRKNCIITKN